MKLYTVVLLPKESEGIQGLPEKNFVTKEYSKAIAMLNAFLRQESRHQLPPVRGEQALRIELDNEFVELWILNTPDADTLNVVNRSAPAVTM
ncbi:hypothetical protein LWM68_40770 [Niabella sp. W65]|nr:hypothetical protein [Niabella sp. W65]MCH7368507.1 hypothetical protein [Niabella sp. W65]ULT44097.1 hypothetical protein KRR40_12465 [Niabella sp. I65]